jgi:hypothetical protein
VSLRQLTKGVGGWLQPLLVQLWMSQGGSGKSLARKNSGL